MMIGENIMQIRPWDIWLAAVKFEDSDEIKHRPVLISENGTVFIVAFKITSHRPRDQWGEYAIKEWSSAKLKKESTVRLNRRLQLDKSELIHYIGKLDPYDIINIQKILKNNPRI